jgi:hypothetical protein
MDRLVSGVTRARPLLLLEREVEAQRSKLGDEAAHYYPEVF